MPEIESSQSKSEEMMPLTDAKSKAALVVVSLGADRASQIYKYLSEQDIEDLTFEVAKLGKTNNAQVEATLDETLCVSPELIYVFGGSKYAEGQQLINWIVLATFINFLYTTIYYNIEYYYKKTMLIAAGTIISTIINIILNVIFMPIYGYKFGAASTVVAYMFLLFMHMIIVEKTTENALVQDRFILSMLGIMFVETWVMQRFITLPIIRIIVGVLFTIVFTIYLFVVYKRSVSDLVKFTL